MKIENIINKKTLSYFFPKRPSRSNKGDYGKILCVCGSYAPDGLSMCGAAFLAAISAYRCGTGLVNICTPKENYVSLSSSIPEAVFTLYDGNNPDLSYISSIVGDYDCVLIGCGLGRSTLSKNLISSVLPYVRSSLVIDADALNMISENPDLLKLIPDEVRKNTVITPHPGEMSRLCEKSINDILSSTKEVATEFALDNGIVCVLKDNRTVISDGEIVYINKTGNPGMSVAGSGDVLAGITASLMSRKDNILYSNGDRKSMDTVTVAAIAVYLHGLSGDIAQMKHGEYSMISRDIVDSISEVIQNIQGL